MLHKYFKLALSTLIVTVAINTSAMFEIKFDGSDLTVNGENINKTTKAARPFVNFGLSAAATWFASKYLINNTQSQQTQVNTLIASVTLGEIATDVLYKDITTKRVLTKTARAIGTITGSRFKDNNVVIDPASLGGHLGAIVASEYYGDRTSTLLTAGQAAGEQLGMHLFNQDENQQQNIEIGQALGSNCGAAFIAHTTLNDKNTRDFFLKKGIINVATIQTTHRYLSPLYSQHLRFYPSMYTTMLNKAIPQLISPYILDKVV